jgi:hypothetical protein
MFSRPRLNLRPTVVLAVRGAQSSRQRLNNKDESDERGDQAAEHRTLL